MAPFESCGSVNPAAPSMYQLQQALVHPYCRSSRQKHLTPILQF